MNREQYQLILKTQGRRVAYEKYIASQEWGKKRLERIKLDKGECRGCGDTEKLHVHHKYPSGYKNIPDESVIDDLTTLCEDCHEALHSLYLSKCYQNRDIKIQFYQSPREAERELLSYGVEDSAIQIDQCQPTNPSQWRVGQSHESSRRRDKENLWKTKEDKSRFRGIG